MVNLHARALLIVRFESRTDNGGKHQVFLPGHDQSSLSHAVFGLGAASTFSLFRYLHAWIANYALTVLLEAFRKPLWVLLALMKYL